MAACVAHSENANLVVLLQGAAFACLDPSHTRQGTVFVSERLNYVKSFGLQALQSEVCKLALLGFEC